MVLWPFGSRRKSLHAKQQPQLRQVSTKEENIDFQRNSKTKTAPDTQSILLLHRPRESYQLTPGYTVPAIKNDSELLVRALAVGLNPIDWKAPDFNFGIPTLPYVAGRELVGEVIQAPKDKSRIRKGDIIIIPSTDYRDLRKAAFQEYSVHTSFNVARLPQCISLDSGAILGVAFVSAAISLGICMGVDFSSILAGPDLLSIVRKIDPERLPKDITKECLEGISEEERAKEGDYLVVWGGSATCAHIVKQLARLAGLRIISVTDTCKHGIRLSSHSHIRPDLLVDEYDPTRAIDIIRCVTDGKARFGFDTLGNETATHLLQALQRPERKDVDLPQDPKDYKTDKAKLPTPPSTPLETLSKSQQTSSHLTGLTGLPKVTPPEGTTFHSVPIKLFHEIPEVGEALCCWLERLLLEGKLVPPDVVGTIEGLEGIEEALGRMRRREVTGGRLVVRLGWQ